LNAPPEIEAASQSPLRGLPPIGTVRDVHPNHPFGQGGDGERYL